MFLTDFFILFEKYYFLAKKYVIIFKSKCQLIHERKIAAHVNAFGLNSNSCALVINYLNTVYFIFVHKEI